MELLPNTEDCPNLVMSFYPILGINLHLYEDCLHHIKGLTELEAEASYKNHLMKKLDHLCFFKGRTR